MNQTISDSILRHQLVPFLFVLYWLPHRPPVGSCHATPACAGAVDHTSITHIGFRGIAQSPYAQHPGRHDKESLVWHSSHKTSGSMPIDRGSAVAGVADDLDGVLRTQGSCAAPERGR